jgi:hypothetical protein
MIGGLEIRPGLIGAPSFILDAASIFASLDPPSSLPFLAVDNASKLVHQP